MAFNITMSVEEDYPNGSDWNYNEWVKKINDTHQAPIDSVGTALPSAGLFDGYGFYNTTDGKYYAYVNNQFRALKHNFNCMVGRGALGGRAFIKNGLGYVELVNKNVTDANELSIAANTAAIATNTAAINRLNDLAYFESYDNYGGSIAMSKNEGWLKGNHAFSTKKNKINYVSNGTNPYILLLEAGTYSLSCQIVLSNNDTSNNPSLSPINIQSVVYCNGVSIGLSYITIEWNKWATIDFSVANFIAPANSSIEIKLTNCTLSNTLLAYIYDTFFSVHSIKR
jgi:hypothetical protein